VRYEDLVNRVLRDSTVHFGGVHGPDHWGRVTENALAIAKAEGSDQRIAMLFGLLHDCQRRSDYEDKGHGRRAAEYAKTIRYMMPKLTNKQFAKLLHALKWHDDQIHTKDRDIAACWDADRLDLPRVGILPEPEYLNTDTGKEMAREVRRQILGG